MIITLHDRFKNFYPFTHMRKSYYIGVDVGGTKIAAALVHPRGKILSRAKVASGKDAAPRKNVKPSSTLSVLFSMPMSFQPKIFQASALAFRGSSGRTTIKFLSRPTSISHASL